MRRVPEVIDVWFDSGSMPFAQFHAPHENEEHFEERFPADFICEALDQTRGWFYSLLAVSTLLFDRSSYRNVVCLGLILDEQGRKMSKSLGNTVEPWDVIDRYGADAFRWYFFTSKQPWDGYRFSLETIGEAVRQFLLQLWNTYAFYVAVRERQRRSRRTAERQPATDLDRLGALAAAARPSRSSASGSTPSMRPSPGARSSEFVEELSNWYVRRLAAALLGRRPGRVPDAARVPRHGRRSCSRRSARSSPMRSTTTSTAREPSVHLCDFPEPGPRDAGLEDAMASSARPSRSGSRRAPRRSSSSASRCARRWSSRRARSARRSSGSRSSFATS